MHIEIGVDASTATEVYMVAVDNRPTLSPLNVDTCSVARNDLVLFDEDLVLRAGLNHDAATFKVLEFALLDTDLGINGDEASCRGIVRCVTLQLAVNHLNRGTIEDSNAGDLAVGFTEDTTMTKAEGD